MSKKTSDWVTQAQFAKLTNVTRAAVNKAIKSGRLQSSLRRTEKNRIEINVKAAQIEWKLNTDSSLATRGFEAELRPFIKPRESRARADEPEENADGSLSITEARRLREEYQGRLAKLKYDLDSGQYVDAKLVKAEWIGIVTTIKTKIMALPSKAKSNMPHLTSADVEVLDRLVREALEDLARDV